MPEITSDVEKNINKEITKEINKLLYYTEQTDELIESGDKGDLKQVELRCNKIIDRLSELISEMEEFKIDKGETGRAVRQWKKETKARYSDLVKEKTRLTAAVNNKQRKLKIERNKRKLRSWNIITELKRKKLKNYRNCNWIMKQRKEMFEQEKQVMREKLEEELKMAEKKFELEREVKRSFSKLPKVKLTPFKVSAVDWVRFENMFLSQVHIKDFSDEEKFTFLLELVTPKICDQIGNLKPGTLGYNTAWQQLKREYGKQNML